MDSILFTALTDIIPLAKDKAQKPPETQEDSDSRLKKEGRIGGSQ